MFQNISVTRLFEFGPKYSPPRQQTFLLSSHMLLFAHLLAILFVFLWLTHTIRRINFITKNLLLDCEDNLLQSEFEKVWLQKYAEANDYQQPPRHYRRWICLARNKLCETDPAHYHRIFSDLGAWKMLRERVLTKPSSAAANDPFVPEEGDELKYFYQPHNVSDAWAKVHYRNSTWLESYYEEFELALQVLDNSKPIHFWHNFPDEPVILLDDSGKQYKYDRPADRLQANNCFREKFGRLKAQNPLILAPSSFFSSSFRIPVFSVAKLDCYLDILMPTTHNGLEAKHPAIFAEINDSRLRWEDKWTKAVFRGQASGINVQLAIKEGVSFTTNPRMRLVRLQSTWEAGRVSSMVPIDFGIVDYLQLSAFAQNASDLYPQRWRMSIANQIRYKYLIVVDGHGWPDRIKWSLLSGSLLFLATIHQEWMIDQLVPYKHYIPINTDMSDLLEKLDWARTHEADAKAIAASGKQYAELRLRVEDVQCYNGLLFMEYQRHFF